MDVAGEVSDEEAAWRELIAGFSAPVTTGDAAPWPAREELPSERETGGPPPGQPQEGGPPADERTVAQPPGPAHDPVPGVVPGPPQARIIRPASPAPLPPADEDDSHFVPPAPPPLPRLDPVTKGAWAALFGGPAYLLIAVMIGWAVPGWAAFTAVAAFVGGFATLVTRMGERPPPGSGPDDGAVV